MAKKYYVVWKGKKTGVFDNWKECEASIKGFKGAQYKSFKTLAAAQAAFKKEYEDFEKEKTKQYTLLQEKPIEESIAVDAAYSSRTKITEYQGVFVKNGQRIFYKKIISGTNNIGEFLAIVHAFALMEQKSINYPVYSDSSIAIRWIKEKRCNTRFDFGDNSEVANLVQRAEVWLNTHDIEKYTLLKWRTEIWGEIPADFGRK